MNPAIGYALMNGPCNAMELLTPKVHILSKRHISSFRQETRLAAMMNETYI